MPPLTRAAQQDREAQTVRSGPSRAGYHCPDRAAVLGHLATVSGRLNAPTLTDAGRRFLRDDLDALLDRLTYLHLMAGADEAQAL